MLFSRRKTTMPKPDEALPGRDTAMPVPETHFVLGTPMREPFPDDMATALFGMGCFWGAERKFWVVPGVHSTQVGYAAGFTPNPTYEEVCSAGTGHNEVVRVVFDPAKVSFDTLLRVFWENHDPTQGMQQGNDVGTQYRSGIYVTNDAQRVAAERSRDAFADALHAADHDAPITTEILDAPTFYYAEPDHQQYLGKNPGGYCGLGGIGVSCPTGVASSNT